MPSSDLEFAEFTDIDWTEKSGWSHQPGKRTLGLVLAFGAVAGLFVYDFLTTPNELFVFMDWDVSQTDWLFLVATVMFIRYAIVPLVANRDRSEKYLYEILTHPGGVLSLAYILLFASLGVIGPDQFFPLDYPRLKYKLQPPVFTAVYVGDLAYYNCVGELANGYCYGTWKYPLGTTRYGENMLELLLYGMRIGLKLGLSAGMIMATIATTVGTTAGYFGGRIDDVLMQYVDVQQTIPAIIVYLVVSIMYLGTLSGIPDGGLFALAIVWGLFDWGGMARLVRSETIQHRTDGYVQAARSAGASDFHVIRKHIIPNSTSTIITALTRQIPLLILAQVALAFLGLNRVESRSLGRVIRMGLTGDTMAWHVKWWVSTIPVLFLICTVIAFYVLGDILRDILSPQ